MKVDCYYCHKPFEPHPSGYGCYCSNECAMKDLEIQAAIGRDNQESADADEVQDG